jgi:hypothetical protein
VIGETAKKVHHRIMERLRILAALLSCLAVFAAALPVVAFASVPAAAAARMQTVAAEPCQHCPDCDGTACTPAAMASMACMVACPGSLPTLGVAMLVLPTIQIGKVTWPSRLAALHGLSSPPDPFPPRS